jgi:integrase
MGRKRSPGLRNRNGIWHIEKQILGRAIHESTGTGDLEAAELILARRIEEVRQAKIYGVRPQRSFREAATRFLEENVHLASIGDYALHLKQMDPYIGNLPLVNVHLGTLQPFIEARRKQGIKTKSINLALAVVRRILNLAARLWRDEHGLSWLETSPLVQMLPVTDARKPYPLSWEEQRKLFKALPDHLARMCLFKVNTGCREQEVCGLRWDWEVQVPQLNTSVFIVPGERVKNREDRLIVLNRIAHSVVEEVRGNHSEHVFTYKRLPTQSINNSSWKRVRKAVGLPMVRVHDLKHTFGRRLRAAGVPVETRKVLLGHRNGDITTHYSAPELAELIEAAELVCGSESGKSPALLMLKHRATI